MYGPVRLLFRLTCWQWRCCKNAHVISKMIKMFFIAYLLDWARRWETGKEANRADALKAERTNRRGRTRLRWEDSLGNQWEKNRVQEQKVEGTGYYWYSGRKVRIKKRKKKTNNGSHGHPHLWRHGFQEKNNNLFLTCSKSDLICILMSFYMI